MRLPIILFFVFSLLKTTSYSQEKTLFKAWSGKNLAYVKIDSQFVYFKVEDNFEHRKRYHIIGDTLSLYETFTTSRDNYRKKQTDNFNFLIAKLTKDELKLIPLDSNSKRISRDKKKLKFIDREKVIDRSFKFNQIKYKIYGTAWRRIDISILVDSNKNFKYINRSNLNKPEYYSSIIPDTLFNEFIAIIKSSEIKKLKNHVQHVADMDEYTIEIDYNKTTKQIKQFILPTITRELNEFIFALRTKLSLKEIQPFKINFSQ